MLGDLGMHHDHLLPHHAYLKNEIPVAGVAHQAGTCRFGTDPATSVLDANCKAHELDNLYVVDTSFFPSIGAVNPALTAMANAIRVGDHLLERLGASTRRQRPAACRLAPEQPVVGRSSSSAAALAGWRRPSVCATPTSTSRSSIRPTISLFQPLIYQVAAGALSSGQVAAPIRHMLERHDNTRVVMATVIEHRR